MFFFGFINSLVCLDKYLGVLEVIFVRKILFVIGGDGYELSDYLFVVLLLLILIVFFVIKFWRIGGWIFWIINGGFDYVSIVLFFIIYWVGLVLFFLLLLMVKLFVFCCLFVVCCLLFIVCLFVLLFIMVCFWFLVFGLVKLNGF